MNVHLNGHVLPEDKEQDIYVVNGHITFQKVKDAKTVVHAGVLAIREPGSPDYASKGIRPDEGLPKVQTGGRFLAPAGRYFPGIGRDRCWDGCAWHCLQRNREYF